MNIIEIFFFQVLRVESPDGTKRVQVSTTESSYDLFEKVIKDIQSLLEIGFEILFFNY